MSSKIEWTDETWNPLRAVRFDTDTASAKMAKALEE